MRRPRREQNSILLNGMASPAGVDLTNDYATGLGTKLDYGFAPAGGHTSDEPAYFAPLLELSLPPYRWRPVSSMTTPDASPVPELDCRATHAHSSASSMLSNRISALPVGSPSCPPPVDAILAFAHEHQPIVAIGLVQPVQLVVTNSALILPCRPRCQPVLSLNGMCEPHSICPAPSRHARAISR